MNSVGSVWVCFIYSFGTLSIYIHPSTKDPGRSMVLHGITATVTTNPPVLKLVMLKHVVVHL